MPASLLPDHSLKDLGRGKERASAILATTSKLEFPPATLCRPVGQVDVCLERKLRTHAHGAPQTPQGVRRAGKL